MLITRQHPFTGKLNTKDLPITQDELNRWQSGELIQNVWPNLSADDREFLLSGIMEWDEHFPPNTPIERGEEDVLTDALCRKIDEIDSISEFGADGFSVTTHPVIGLQRWEDKQYMLSFFPTDIKNNRLQYQSKIDKVYDLFLTEEQVEVIVEEYNRRNGIFSE